MRRLLDERILADVETPARYLGGEKNSIRKDPARVDVSFALLFPDLYGIGMSHLGGQILYSVVNRLDWAAAERAYAVWPDMQAKMREHGVPLYALESFRPVREFDVVGFSLQYELLYTNVLAMLELAGIPLGRTERGPEDPIVIAGGPGAASPEPMADFIDLFFLGDGEESIAEFARLVRRMKAEGRPREEIVLQAARRVTGVYAPGHYDVSYNADGTVSAVRPAGDGVPARIRAAKVADLGQAHYPTDLIVPFVETVHDRITLEIMRGCVRGCRFCQAGMLRRPLRPRPPGQLTALAREAYAKTGHHEIALASLSSSDYPEFHRLLERMGELTTPHGVALSLSSLRVGDQLRLLPGLLGQVRKSGLTVAPEAATERLRAVINKPVTDEELLEGARAAFREGWRHIKLYFMIGLPTETDQDLRAIADLSEAVSTAGRDAGLPRAGVNVSIASFVPKPHTPFQWEAMAPPDYLLRARDLIRKATRHKAIRHRFHDVETSLVEAALARGDRRLGRVLRRVHEAGGQFDAWMEHFSFQRWQDAFDTEGLSMAFYALRERPTDEVLPWQHLDFGLRPEFLLQERERAHRALVTPDCLTGPCSGCGVCADARRHEVR
ncbi:MAG: TIGR03960 family B12-binding radical SAM protein [Candidatus Brocadiaceae bacterium]|nr:TIGR03960 family B12-binding radical SAM protein [Candidatus Brocadiaceae bacterium]